MGRSGLVLRRERSGPGYGLQAAIDRSSAHGEAGCVGGSGSRAHLRVDLRKELENKKMA
jgi:hypothetical protein